MKQESTLPVTLGSDRADLRIPIFLALIFVVVLTALIGRKNGYTVDATSSFHLTQEILRQGTLFPPVAVKQGYIYSIVYIPFYLLSDVLHGFFPGCDADFLRRKCMCWMNTVITGLTIGLLSLVVKRLDFSRRAQIAVPLLYGFSTLAFAYARYDYNKCLAAFLLLGAFYFFLLFLREEDTKMTVVCGCCLGLLAALRLEMTVVVPAFLYVLLQKPLEKKIKIKQAMVLLTPILLGILFVVWYNRSQGRGTLEGGYEVSFNANPLPAIAGFLFSPGKSLLLFNPVLFLLPLVLRPFRERCGVVFFFWLIVISPLFLLYSFWGNWWGGWGWGPRHLVPLLPLLVLPMAAAIDSESRDLRRTVIVLGILGLVVQLIGTALDFNDVIMTLMRAQIREDELIWNPVWNPILQHVLFLFHRPFILWDYGIIALFSYWFSF